MPSPMMASLIRRVLLLLLILPASHAGGWFGTKTTVSKHAVVSNAMNTAVSLQDNNFATNANTTTTTQRRRVVVAVDGGTESIRAACFDAQTGEMLGQSCAAPYETRHPQPGWAEQDPADWYECLGKAVRGAVASLSSSSSSSSLLQYDEHEEGSIDTTALEITAMAIDTTCCSVVALDDNFEPLRPCILWMDQRAAPQCRQIGQSCRRDPALRVCGHDGQSLSAEWMTPKALWIRQNEYETVWKKTVHLGEYQDYLNYKLTGVWCASSCNAAARWNWDGVACLSSSSNHHSTQDDSDDAKDNRKKNNNNNKKKKYPGRPLSLYRKLGIPEIADKLPHRCLAMGQVVGGLTEEAAAHLTLPAGLPVVQGGPDAFVGMIGLGCIAPGQLCLITGSSHLHCAVSGRATTARGIWGAYRGAPLPSVNFAEGGQSSTGSILRWARRILFRSNDETESYADLDAQAAAIPPGADGLVALETWQGSRTPVTDPRARGALLGLTLSHTRAHIWRALLEAVALGTRACLEGLQAAGHRDPMQNLTVAGGATASPLWLQLHADVTNQTVVVCETAEAPLLGCAILASTGGSGEHNGSVATAVRAMVRTAQMVRPDPDRAAFYDQWYRQVYAPVADAVRPMAHAMHALRGGATNLDDTTNHARASSTSITISPSLLAGDWSDMQAAVHECLAAGAPLLHVDIFDGVYLDSPHAFTFGPQMVQAIRKSCQRFYAGHDDKDDDDKGFLDLHVCVDRPARFVPAMQQAGADRFIFQWEAVSSDDDRIALARHIVVQGSMQCGVSINPATPVDVLWSFLRTGWVSVVDVLAVEPGFGGQAFQESVLDKVRALRDFRDRHNVSFDIMVDGGVSDATVDRIVEAGADVLVSGSYLFRHPGGVSAGVKTLLRPSS